MLPNFLIIGAAKAGTTSLYHYLRQHPKVFMPETKELSFFVAEDNWHLGLGWYERQFDGGEDALAIGEASPRYAMYPVYWGVSRRIADLLPEVRLIYVVRHPIERMRSHYLDLVIYGAEKEPIETALLKNPKYLNASRYALQIEQYLEHFPRGQLLVITSEQLREARRETVRRILEFLGVESGWQPAVLGREFHRTAERRIPRPFAQRVIRSPVYRTLGRVAPTLLRRLSEPFLTRRVDISRAAIPDGLERRLKEMLREDVGCLCRYMDRSFDGWGIG